VDTPGVRRRQPERPGQYGRAVSEVEVRARVEAFVADFCRRWERAGRMPSAFRLDPEVFDAWADELAELVDTHCTAGVRTGAEGSLSGNPAHDPATETITDVQVEEDRATVRSAIESGVIPTYYEYRLVRVDREWRIRRLLSFLDPPGAPLVDQATAQILLRSASPDSPLPKLPSHLQLDVPGLFAETRRVAPFGDPVPLEVVSLGEMTCRSGVLTVRDLGYRATDLAPLARRVTPGTYRAEVSRAAGTNVALRLRFSDVPAVNWHPAELADGTNVVGVDAGNVAILDLATMVGCEAQHIEELYDEQSRRLLEEAGTVFSLTGDVSDAVMVTSGCGDGAYPCYWGVAADGTPTTLVIDFLVLAEDNVDVIAVPWQPGPVDTPELAGYDLEITTSGESFVVSHRGHDIGTLRVLAPDGTTLMDGALLGTFVTEGRHSRTWEPETPPPPGSVLEVAVHRGYRHT